MNKLYISLALLLSVMTASLFGVSNIKQYVNLQKDAQGQTIPVLVLKNSHIQDSRVVHSVPLMNQNLWISAESGDVFIATKAGVFTLWDRDWDLKVLQFMYPRLGADLAGIQSVGGSLGHAGGDFKLTILENGTLKMEKIS